MSRNKQDFFHGGVGHLQPGDLVLPSAVHGGLQTTESGTSYAWASRNPVEAAGYAKNAAQRTGAPGRVYRVRPIDGDDPVPAHTPDRKTWAQGRETGWVVDSPVWSTEHQNNDRLQDVNTSSAKMSGYRSKRKALTEERSPKKPQTRVSPQTQAILDLL